MADDDIDVEGEFDLKTELGDEFYDTNELPSKSANLLPEFTSPAWMLEQGWTLDSCMDEKSKATIEKMLLEEQQYMYGRKSSRYLNMKKSALLAASGSSKGASPNKCPWTPEEKSTFLNGLGIYGRSWSKIANLIPTRTSLQVKNYAQQYMKNLVKKKTEIEKSQLEALKSMTETPLFTTTPLSLAATVASVTTGQPTISVATSSVSEISNNISDCSLNTTNTVSDVRSSTLKAKRPVTPLKKNLSSVAGTSQTAEVKPHKQTAGSRKHIKVQKKLHSSTHNGVVAYADVSEMGGGNQETELITFAASKFRHKGIRPDNWSCISDCGSAVNGSSVGSSSSSSTEPKTSSGEDEDVEVDIDIEDDDSENAVLLSRSASPSSVYQQLLKSADIEQEQLSKGHMKLGTPGPASVEGSDVEEPACSPDESSHSSDKIDSPEDGVVKSEHSLEDFSKEKQEDEEDQVKTESIGKYVSFNGVVAASGEVIEFDIPVEEKLFHPMMITEEEKRVHADFFDGRPPKTPERYLKIRSYIIDCWLKSKPVYLNKTCIRPGLKNCGDVNCIGRIHSYLECVGAINFGCEQAAYRNPHRTVSGSTNSRVRGMNKELISSLPVSKSESTRPRKRRIKDETGLWVDEKELEGKTVEHNSERKKSDVNRRARVARASKVTYDPFKLVPCQPFSEGFLAPYKIDIFNTALATMDIHAHISKTEVIGMLGGQFCAETGQLTISMAVPCKSMSTGMQCEMDPVSQTLASEQIEDVGMSVVGWYHSHPTFSPDPSLRDIETQQKFQYWFSKGGNHFVGIIISPYNTCSPHAYSDIQCLTVSKTQSTQYPCNLPFKFDYKIIYRENLREILGPASELAEKYSNYVNRVMLSCQYKSSLGITCLSKMLQSVKRHLIPPDDDVALIDVVATTAAGVNTAASEHNPQASESTSAPSPATIPSSTSSLTARVPQTVSKHKIEEVLQWLEQIFLEKFSQSTPRSPPMSSLSSSPRLPASEIDHPPLV
ncbi:unnamed protein product [Candidula unifasciata]|uniref:Myb-like, SWIRM and MPN domain-containing protein 1 n=1 Tax=Candidula unifasciata TaxID=100452 RepID=A0A8S4A068_9EUPU|nr:unnamed protein product [Candidula unifasciata]